MPSQDTMPAFPVQDGVRFAHIEGFPGYAVSDDGGIWSCRYPGVSTGYYGHWNRLSTKPNSIGYAQVTLLKNAKPSNFKVHNLVLEAFVGPRPEGFECCHGNGIKMDNRLINLRWDTIKSNCADQKKHGTKRCGTDVKNAILTDDIVRSIRREYVYGSATNGTHGLARRFGVRQSTVWGIVNRKQWTHVID